MGKDNSKYYDWTVKIKAQDSRFKAQASKFICFQRSFIKGVKKAEKRIVFTIHNKFLLYNYLKKFLIFDTVCGAHKVLQNPRL